MAGTSDSSGAASIVITTSPPASNNVPSPTPVGNGVSATVVPGTIPVRLVEREKVAISRINTNGTKQSGGGQVGRGEGRSAHNAIEKRYRLSINDKIVELRELIAGKDSKVSTNLQIHQLYGMFLVSSNVQSISVTWFSPSPILLTARVSSHLRARRLSYHELALNSGSVHFLFLDL